MNKTFPEDGGDPAVEGEEDAEEKRKQFKKQRSKQSREFEVEGDIAKPEFMATKSMVDYAPAEISAVEQYEALLAEQAERKSIRRRQLEVDRVELKRKITESVLEFDAKLLELYKTRLAIEKCILAEELKILLYDRRMAYQAQCLKITKKSLIQRCKRHFFRTKVDLKCQKWSIFCQFLKT